VNTIQYTIGKICNETNMNGFVGTAQFGIPEYEGSRVAKCFWCLTKVPDGQNSLRFKSYAND
jgi:hypothetical protein